MSLIWVTIFFLIAIVTLSQALTKAEAEAIDKQDTDACIKETSGLTPDEIKRINQGKIMSKDQPSASNHLQCFLLCYYKKIGIIDTNGKRTPTVLLEYMGNTVKYKSKMTEIMQKCAGTTGTNPCESIYKFEKCVFDLSN